MSLLDAIGPELVLATHNKGKVAEFATLLAPLGITVVSAGDLGLPEPEETGRTFAENAILKAAAASRATGKPALADDSGLCVSALNDDPGIYSARWAGPGKDFGAAMERVLSGLRSEGAITPEQREARFVAVLALTLPQEDEAHVFEGVCSGTIAASPRGTNGFGYDPLFIPADADGRTFGEMTGEEKAGGPDPLSHRARAVSIFMEALGLTGEAGATA
ncbi:dITP/XTP pyrophosphatase [Stappia sp. 22II-S9-Z10]|nr:dITP/XTP pyrophosphatase [Stappia sp. 22II-S9-Z10]